MSASAPRARPRSRLYVDESVRLAVEDVGPLADDEAPGTKSLSLRWPGSSICLTLEGDAERFRIHGTPRTSEVSWMFTQAGACRVRLFRCPGCGLGRKHLYLAPGADSFACRRCSRLVYRPCGSASPIERLERAASALVEDVQRLKWLSSLGERPQRADVQTTAKRLRQECERLRRIVLAATPLPVRDL